MAAALDASGPLLWAGALMGAVLVMQLFAVRHLRAEAVPGVLKDRIALSNRLRPWLIVAALLMLLAGLALRLG